MMVAAPGQTVPHRGACGAVPGVRNPIRLAHIILRAAQDPCPVGRIRPTLLCGHAAWRYAVRNGLPAASGEAELREYLVTEPSRRRYKRNATRPPSAAPGAGPHVINQNRRVLVQMRRPAVSLASGSTWPRGPSPRRSSRVSHMTHRWPSATPFPPASRPSMRLTAPPSGSSGSHGAAPTGRAGGASRRRAWGSPSSRPPFDGPSSAWAGGTAPFQLGPQIHPLRRRSR